jgi:hypothetical protein
MKEPEPNDARRCLKIRKRSKREGDFSADDMHFCDKILAKYPEWYANTEEEVFNDTVPYGSSVKYKDVCH